MKQTLDHLMPAILTSFLILPSAQATQKPSFALATDHPYLFRLRGEYQLFLPAAMQQSLDQSVKGFAPWREIDFMPVIRQDYAFTWQQSPFAVVGDFNGDRHPDVAISGHTAKATVLLAIISHQIDGRLEFQVKVIDQGGLVDPAFMGSKEGPDSEKGLGAYLQYVPSGTYISGYEKGPLILKQGAFEEIYYGKAAGTYFWNGKTFAWYVTGD